jgi:hypothetical protein
MSTSPGVRVWVHVLCHEYEHFVMSTIGSCSKSTLPWVQVLLREYEYEYFSMSRRTSTSPWVGVRVLLHEYEYKYFSMSMSTSTSHDYEYKYFSMSMSTSTSLWVWIQVLLQYEYFTGYWWMFLWWENPQFGQFCNANSQLNWTLTTLLRPQLQWVQQAYDMDTSEFSADLKISWLSFFSK